MGEEAAELGGTGLGCGLDLFVDGEIVVVRDDEGWEDLVLGLVRVVGHHLEGEESQLGIEGHAHRLDAPLVPEVALGSASEAGARNHDVLTVEVGLEIGFTRGLPEQQGEVRSVDVEFGVVVPDQVLAHDELASVAVQVGLREVS